MILLSKGQKVLSLCQAIGQWYIRAGWHAVTTKCDFMLENVDWLAQLRRALRVENYFSWRNQLPLDGSLPTWRAVYMLISRWGSLGSWSNVFCFFFPPAGYHLPASSLLQLPECLSPLPQPLILPDGMDLLFVPIFWIKAGEEVEETSLPHSSGSLSIGREGSGGKNVYTYDYTHLHVFQRSHWSGKVTFRVFSVVCSLGNNVTFTDDQGLLCFSNYANENGCEGFGQGADSTLCPSEFVCWR